MTAQLRAESPGPDATVTCSLHAATLPQPMQSPSCTACTLLSFRLLAHWRTSKRSTPDPAPVANDIGPVAAAADVEQQVRPSSCGAEQAGKGPITAIQSAGRNISLACRSGGSGLMMAWWSLRGRLCRQAVLTSRELRHRRGCRDWKRQMIVVDCRSRQPPRCASVSLLLGYKTSALCTIGVIFCWE